MWGGGMKKKGGKGEIGEEEEKDGERDKGENVNK